MIRFLTFIFIAVFIVLLTVSRVDGGMIHAPAYSDVPNTWRSPVIEDFAPSSGTSVLPIFSAENSGSNMLEKVMLSPTSTVREPLDFEDSATMPQGEISNALLAEVMHASDAMLIPTVTEVVSRILKDSDGDHSLNGRDENIHKLQGV